MKKADIKITAYETGIEDFMIDIVETKFNGKKERETWLYRKDFCVKDFVIGEFEEYWEHLDLRNYAESMIDYLSTDTNNDGDNWFEEYKKNHI